MTLIELVVVVGLLLLLAAIALPTVRMAIEGRRVREAARAVNVYLGSARNRAMATGRPVGVVLQRFATEPGNPYNNVCITLHQVEAPPPYAGDEVSCRAAVGYLREYTAETPLPSGCDEPYPDYYPFIVFFDGQINPDFVREGDQIQFDNHGHWFTILADPPDWPCLKRDHPLPVPPPPWRICGIPKHQIHAGLVPDDVRAAWPWPDYLLDDPPSERFRSRLMPYEIRRRPGLPGDLALRASIAKPLQLPLDAVVDLTFSGGAGGDISPRALSGYTDPVVIMFSPTGGVDVVHYSRYDPDAGSIFYESVRPTEPIYLLIGKRERIPRGEAEDGRSNLEDLESLWIALSPQTGLVTTVENAPVVVDPNIDFDDQLDDLLHGARYFAREGQMMGGR